MRNNAGILGIGVDMADVGRFKSFKPGGQNGFLKKVFSKKELDYCFSFTEPASRLAGLFAAKEAVVKACGGGNIAVSSIEICHDSFGQPKVRRSGKISKNMLISISHTQKSACAVALLVSQKNKI